MKVFTDKTGKEWDVSLSIGALKRIKSFLGIDLLDPVQIEKFQENMASDPSAIAELIFAVVKRQADARGIIADDFYDALDTEALLAAAHALTDALVDFIPSPQRPTLRAKIAEDLKKLEEDGDLSMTSPVPSDSTPTG